MIRLPIDTKSLYFNIRNDNIKGHTPTVASPLKKIEGKDKLENILLIKCKEIDISSLEYLVSLLIKYSKTSVIIKNVFVFDKLSINGKNLKTDCSFGCYVKEEVDETKVQFGRLKLHYPSKFVYEDNYLNINNKKIFKCMSETLNNYAFIVRAFEYYPEKGLLNFDALIVGENDIPYSKVFINGKGIGNKLNTIFNENADDYDREIISLRKKFGEDVNPYNFLEYSNKMKDIALEVIKNKLNIEIEYISNQYPYSLFDFCYLSKGVKKYGIMRVTATKINYFNISFVQQAFMMNNENDAQVFMLSNIFDKPNLKIYNYKEMINLNMQINSMKYEEE